MRILLRTAVFMAASLLLCAVSFAQDVESLRNELSDMKSKMAGMESRLADATGGSTLGHEGSGFTSLKQNAKVEIGAGVAIDVLFKSRDNVTSDHDHIDSVEFTTNSADLRFKILPATDDNVYLYIKLDLDDFWADDRLDTARDQDDLLEECKFVWSNVRNSNWGLVFGKGEVPYGQDRTLGIIQSYHHNHGSIQNDNVYTSEGPTFLTGVTEAGLNPLTNGYGSTPHPGEVDNVFMMSANYSFQNFMKLELTVFQNGDTGGNGMRGRGMNEDRPDDNLLAQSYSARLWFLPTEELTIELSAINMHVDSYSDTSVTGYGERSRPDQYAISLGFTYKSATMPIEFFGEYQHGWDWGYTKDYDCDIAQLGFLYSVTGQFDLGMMYELFRVNDTRTGDAEKWTYQKAVVSGQYELASGIKCILEYGYEYANGQDADDDDRNAHLIGFRTAWTF